MEADSETARYIERLQQQHSDRSTSHRNGTSSAKTTSSADPRSTGRNGPEVKISFGPSRPPAPSKSTKQHHMNHSTGTSNSYSASAAAATMAAMMGGGDASVSFGDLEALKEKAAAAAAGQTTFRNKHGLPCSESEMKALMSMFVEIMGMSMMNSSNNSDGHQNMHNTTGKNDSSNSQGYSHKSGNPVFRFNANTMDPSTLKAMAAAVSGSAPGMMPDHMAAATAGFFADGASWEALRRTYAAAEQMAAVDDNEDDDDDDDSFENRELTFEEVEFLLHHRKQKEEAAKLASQFASGDWESLEQVAINDHLLSSNSETDDRERKAAKKREKKQRRKAKQKEEAAKKAAEAAQKKREKATLSWRSRVVSACQSNEVTKLDGLLQESPLRKMMEEENDYIDDNNCSHLSTTCTLPHLEFLLPNSVAKNRAHVDRGIEARLRLAEYVLQAEIFLAFKPLRTGRTVLHTACFNGDVRFLELLFEKVESYDGDGPPPTSFLDLKCDESGWTPLHYAVVSGSSDVMELLLAKGSSLTTRTDVTHTWRESDGKGLTPRELVQCVQGGNYEKIIETHGLALQEITNAFFSHHQERRLFLKKLERVYHRLSSVEKNGYTPLSSKESNEDINESEKQSEVASNNNRPDKSTSRNKKKKKKKKKQKESESSIAPPPTSAESPKNSAATSTSIKAEEKEDPLVTALIGMGFTASQINAAVKACGGTHRATADNLVTWILGQGDSEESPSDTPSTSNAQPDNFDQKNDESKANDNIHVKEEQQRHNQEMEEARQKEETARRLAAKREEARRRNREWNNREQARQEKEKEAKAKVAQKKYGASRASMPPLMNGIPTSRQPKLAVGAPELTGGSKWGVPPSIANAQPRSFTGPTPAASSNQSRHIATKTTISGASSISGTAESQNLPVTSFFAINDDDKTVSSLGSNRGISVSSKEFIPAAQQPPVPPPGFLAASNQPITAPARSSVPSLSEVPSSGAPFAAETRHGEIRATAKAFVPSFSISARPATTTGATSNNDFSISNDVGNGTSDVIGFPPGMLPTQGMASADHSSLLVSGLSKEFNNDPSMTAVTGSGLVSGTSFANGPKVDQSSLSIPFGFGQADSNVESNDIGGSRLLNSFSRNMSGGNSSVGNIWGENSGMLPSLESTLQPSFFGDGEENKNASWGVSAASGNAGLSGGNRQGSIW